jgi:hypothetical protein
MRFCAFFSTVALSHCLPLTSEPLMYQPVSLCHHFTGRLAEFFSVTLLPDRTPVRWIMQRRNYGSNAHAQIAKVVSSKINAFISMSYSGTSWE